MHRTGLIIGVVIIVAAVAAAAYTLSRMHAPAPAGAPQQNGTGNASVGATGASAIVTYSDEGFSPSSLTVPAGTTVTWINRSSRTMRIEGMAGGPDEGTSVSAGGTYSYTFAELGTARYANHDASGDTGTIIVTDAAAAGPINPEAIPE